MNDGGGRSVAARCAVALAVLAAPVAAQIPAVWVIDNADPDYKNPPFEDTLTLLGPAGEVMASDLEAINIAGYGGSFRRLAVAPGGKSAFVCEIGRLTKFDGSAQQLWSTHISDLMSVCPSDSGRLFVLAGSSIYGQYLHEIDPNDGQVLQTVSAGGLDLLVDDERQVLWTVGADVKKLTLDLQLQFTIDPIGHMATSVDLAADGSIWVAERESSGSGGANRLLNVLPDGTLGTSIPLATDPSAVRVDRSDGSLWVAFFSQDDIRKFAPDGTQLFTLADERALALHLDPSDGSVWAAGHDTAVRHFSAQGDLLHRTEGYSTDQAWVAAADVLGGPIGENYCGPASLNSSGASAVISAIGIEAVHFDDLVLTAADLPVDQFGYFLTSQTKSFIPFPGGSQGYLCLGGSVGRYNRPGEVLSSGPGGSFTLKLDLSDTPQPGGSVAIAPGETWNFQAWFRDVNPQPTSNFTDGLSVLFQ